MNKLILGIDPGVSGGMALITYDGKLEEMRSVVKITEADICEFVQAHNPHIGMAYLERVGARPGQTATGMWKFAVNYGVYRGLLRGLNIPTTHVMPATWQRKLNCLTKGDKNITKARAQELFPEERKITHATADAILIAEYGRRDFNLNLRAHSEGAAL